MWFQYCTTSNSLPSLILSEAMVCVRPENLLKTDKEHQDSPPNHRPVNLNACSRPQEAAKSLQDFCDGQTENDRNKNREETELIHVSMKMRICDHLIGIVWLGSSFFGNWAVRNILAQSSRSPAEST